MLCRLGNVRRRFQVKYNLPQDSRKVADLSRPRRPVVVERSGRDRHLPSAAMTHYNYPQLTSVSSGYGFAVGISESGDLYGRGVNTMGQLGLQVTAKSEPVELVEKFTKIHFDETFHGEECRAIQVSCGRHHFAALLENGDIVLFGSNHAGQLGARPHYREGGHHVIHTKSLLGAYAAKVQCGMDHTVVLLDNGKVATFGLGCDGQLGLGSLDNCHAPTIVPSLSNIVDISVAADWTMVLDGSGAVFAWGNNEYAQITDIEQERIDQIHTPTKIDFPNEVTKIASTMNMGFAMVQSGQLGSTKQDLYTWGYGNHFSNVEQKTQPNKLFLPAVGNIINIDAGVNAAILTTDEGVRLALGVEQNQMFSALDPAYRFNVTDFKAIDQLVVGFDSVLCSVRGSEPGALKAEIEEPKVEEPVSRKTEPEIIEKEPPQSEVSEQLLSQKSKVKDEKKEKEVMVNELVSTLSKEKPQKVEEFGYVGHNYDPLYERRKYSAELLQRFGDDYDPDFSKKKKFGDNYDPDFLKNTLGDKYDPNFKYDPTFQKKKFGDAQQHTANRSFRAYAPKKNESLDSILARELLGPHLYQEVMSKVSNAKVYDQDYLQRTVGGPVDLGRKRVPWQGLSLYDRKKAGPKYTQEHFGLTKL